MALKYKHNILLVDDEEAILKSLGRLLRKENYEFYTVTSGKEGIEFLENYDEPVSLIISDQRMPQMMGTEFLERAKVLSPETIRILLTGYSDMDAIVDAVNKGEIHRYITKPWDDKGLLIQIRQALELVELTRENRRLLKVTQKQNEELSDLNNNLEQKVRERTARIGQQNVELKKINMELEKGFYGTIRLMSSMIATINPALGEHLQDVAKIATKIASSFDLDEHEVERIKLGALIHDIGLLGLSENLWQRDTSDLTQEELEVFVSHPLIAATSLESVDQLVDLAEIVLHHHEDFSGEGFPNGLRKDEIPLGSRIVAVAAEYCRILSTWPKDSRRIFSRAKRLLGALADNITVKEPDSLLREVAVKLILLKSVKKYDPDIVAKLVTMVSEELKSRNEEISRVRPYANPLILTVNELEEGMVLVKDVRLNDNRLVLGEGSKLRKNSIETIQKFVSNKLVDDAFHVLNTDISQLKFKP